MLTGPPGRHRRVDPALLARIRRPTARVLGALYVAVALFGALNSTLQVIGLVVPLFGALGALVARGLHRALRPHARVPPSSVLPAAVVAGLYVPFLTGMENLGSVRAHVSTAIVLLGAVVGACWAYEGVSRQTASPTDARHGLPDVDLASLGALLAALPLEELLHEWRRSGRQLREDRQVAAQLREALLEEIERRDPRGFEWWLLDGLDLDPGDYIDDTNGHGASGQPDGPAQ